MSRLYRTESLTMDVHEHFIKQTIRNRCHILSPNGIQTLVVPVSHVNRQRTAIREIRISNDQNWQRQHWRSLCAAYQRSAFFEFYQDELASFYEKRFEFLLDFNNALLYFLMDQLHCYNQIDSTTEYQFSSTALVDDLRYCSDARIASDSPTGKSYPQVFGYKFGFVTGLSFVDLLFNAGPASKNYI